MYIYTYNLYKFESTVFLFTKAPAETLWYLKYTQYVNTLTYSRLTFISGIGMNLFIKIQS